MGAGPQPVILSLDRMRAVRAVYPTENVLVCDAGVILANVQQAADNIDRLFPLSLASEGSARMARQQATLLGCKGTHYRRFGTTNTYTIAPCENDKDEFQGLSTNRFATHADVGTSVDGQAPGE